jgi:Ca2+-binding RTX toxin-like protein
VKSRMLVAALPTLALLVAPSLADAATVAAVQEDDTGAKFVLVDDDDGAGDIDVELAADGTNPVIVVRSAGGMTAGPGCEKDDATGNVGCADAAGLAAVIVRGFGGNDSISLKLIADNVPPMAAGVAGGEGDDTLEARPDNRDVPQPETLMEGGNGNDTITSGNGSDELHGDAGNDTIQAFLGADAVFGGEGDDSVSGGTTGADRVDGGPGNDSIPDGGGDYSRIFKGAVMTISLDGAANDGEAGEGDNVTSVEKLVARGGAVTLIGDAGPNDFFAEAGAVTLRGLGGNDRLVSYDGDDTLDGGDGDDYLEAGFGNDVLDGGGGVDSFNADRTGDRGQFAVGNDDVRARDGNAEQISCGIGSGDKAQVDANDIVGADCESIDKPKDPEVVLVPGKPKITGKKTIRAIASKGLTITVSCPLACAVTGELRVGKKLARKLKLGKSRVLARGKRSTTGAGTAKVVVKVVKKARKRFRRLKRAKVTLVTKTVMAGKTTPTSRKLNLKR